ncbi:MAG: glycosyltransferase family 4 protein, partial [Frankiaceae bacterium]
DEHNIESELLHRHGAGERSWARRRFNSLESWKQEVLEGNAWRKVAACAVTSEREVATVAARAPQTRIAVVPNAVDLDFFSPAEDAVAVNPRSVVFTGLMSYRPNLDGARYLVDEIFPRVRATHPETVLTIVGAGNRRELDALRREGVAVTGFVPDVRPFIAGAACVLVPLRIGGGTRLKVVEALGMGRPIVSTSLGCEGIDVVSGEQVLVADEPEAFAAAVCRVLDHPELGRLLGSIGRELVVARYSWEHSAQRLRELFEAVTGQRHAEAVRANPTTAVR